jgi:hypothetical protein
MRKCRTHFPSPPFKGGRKPNRDASGVLSNPFRNNRGRLGPCHVLDEAASFKKARRRLCSPVEP